MAIGGIVVFLVALPVARSAWLAQETDALYAKVRLGQPYSLDELRKAIALMNASIAADPAAFRIVQRSELLGAAAATRALKVSDAQRREWQLQAKADLEVGLANDPARTLDWQRLAIIHEWLGGASRDVPPLLFRTLELGRMMSPLWPSRLRIILDNWGYFDDAQKATLEAYVVMTWRRTDDRRWFGKAIYDPFDEVILRSILRNEPKAQEELTKLIQEARK